MKSKVVISFTVLTLVALPMFVGFAGPDASRGTLNRIARNSDKLVHELFSMRSASARDDDAPYSAYTEALDVLKNEYYGEKIDAKKSKELTYSAIRGMLFSLNDPFTSFLDREDWLQMQQMTRGDFEGIGAVLEPFGQDVRVVRPIEDSPAYHAGLKPHDVVVSVGTYEKGVKVRTTSTLGKNINEVVKLIKGPQGTKVDVTVMRKGSMTPITFHLVRAHIEPPTIRYWMEDDQNKIGHILLNEFNEKSTAQFDKAYATLMKQGMRGLVFDLRYNPGGLLNVAVDIGRRFVDHGPVVVIQEKNGQQQGLPHSDARTHDHLPVAVLVNENSASASEIVAGAIKDSGVGTIVGEHTFGKGLVQTLFPLNDGSALRLTTAKYFTPKLVDISNKYDEEHRPIFGTGGIKPDVVVKQPEAFIDQDWTDENKKNDAQLKKAIDILRTRLAAVPGRVSR
jgi:carboxyl-terminal processing protease